MLNFANFFSEQCPTILSAQVLIHYAITFIPIWAWWKKGQVSAVREIIDSSDSFVMTRAANSTIYYNITNITVPCILRVWFSTILVWRQIWQLDLWYENMNPQNRINVGFDMRSRCLLIKSLKNWEF